jgi:hypothetical protein
MRLLTFRAAVLLACAGLAGCSFGRSWLVVGGEVKLDGSPVKQGHIRFEPAEGLTASCEVFIEDGRYTAHLMPGTYKVAIRSPRVTGKVSRGIDGPGTEADVVEETILPRYNDKTELSIEVTKGSKRHDFLLTND